MSNTGTSSERNPWDSEYFSVSSFYYGQDTVIESKIYQLRYQVYCLERGFLPQEDYPNQLETDKYDLCSTHVAIFANDGKVVGAMRLVEPPPEMLFPFQEHCQKLFPEAKEICAKHRCIEASRMVISKDYRRRFDDTAYGISSHYLRDPGESGDVLSSLPEGVDRRRIRPVIVMGLLREVYRHAKRNGITHCFIAVEQPLARLLRGLHFTFTPVGEEEDYYGPVTPFVIEMSQLESDLYTCDPVTFAWFQQGLESTTEPRPGAPIENTSEMATESQRRVTTLVLSGTSRTS